jgi:hypothetical protein
MRRIHDALARLSVTTRETITPRSIGPTPGVVL